MEKMNQSNAPFVIQERYYRLKLRLSIVQSFKFQMQLTPQGLMKYHSSLMETLDRPPFLLHTTAVSAKHTISMIRQKRKLDAVFF